jgi:hypothetical protein
MNQTRQAGPSVICEAIVVVIWCGLIVLALRFAEYVTTGVW